MSPSIPLVEVASLSFGAALLLTPLARRLAVATGSLDHPNTRKTHPEPTPLLGGLAVAAAAVLGPVLARSMLGTALRAPHPGILVGAILSLAIGLWDDRRPMPPWGKLIGQLLVAALLVYWGTEVPALRAHPLAGAVALLAVAALLNAINFLDAADGIVAALVPVTAGGFAALALLGQAPVNLALAWALVGACCGFLVYNAPPARIFLGDAGSHVLGFALAALGIQALGGGVTWPRVAAVLLLFAYPFFDVLFVIGDRLLGGRPIYVAGVDHSIHRLGRLCGHWGTLGLVTIAAALNSLMGIWVWSRARVDLAVGALLISALAYAVFGFWLRRACPTPGSDT
ncbi:MAG TPA: MraY family glycosyltransferase [Candidatus Eisenbacteria bacterium]